MLFSPLLAYIISCSTFDFTYLPYFAPSLLLAFGQKNVFVDVGAKRMLAAEKGKQKIVVEIKSFQGASDIRDLEQAIGQYVFYRSLLSRFEVERKLYLALPYSALIGILEEAIARPVLEDEQVAIIAFDAEKERIVQWSR